jgi:hypothetical protein
MKTCFKCHQTKPLNEFYQHKMMGDGHLNKCKSCTKNDARERERKLRITDLNWVEKELERQRIKSQKRREDGYLSPVQNLAKSAWAAKNRHKRKAHNAVRNAVRNGKIIPSPCEICGSEQAEAHHDDYSKPLDVRWLCKKHHMQVHIELNKMKRQELFNSNKL